MLVVVSPTAHSTRLGLLLIVFNDKRSRAYDTVWKRGPTLKASQNTKT